MISFTNTMNQIKQILIILLLVLHVSGCKDENIEGPFSTATDYYPVAIGKSWTYRMDSTGPFNFGSFLRTTAYHIRDSVASDTFRDNNNRLVYTVLRYITDTLRSAPWQYQLSYFVTPTSTGLELLDDKNLRYIKLITPVSEGRSWQGNSYIDTYSAGSLFRYMDNWNYQYQQAGAPDTVSGNIFQNTVTVFQRDETSPDLPFDPEFYQQRNLSTEVYAKDIGLIYKEFLHWTWQTTPPPSRYEDDSYGIKLQLLEYR